MTAFFVTGTDTGVGKTAVAAAILRAVRAGGRRVAAVKPAESGCEKGPDGLRPADADELRAAAGGWQQPEGVCVYRLEAPVAPAVAAEREGVRIEADVIAARVAAARASSELCLVEGAGGLLVPLTPELVMADLARLLELPVVVVGRDALGTINHTLLTVEAARARGLEVAGVVLSQSRPDEVDPSQQNAREIERVGQVKVIGTLPYAAEAEARAALAASHLDLDWLLRST